MAFTSCAKSSAATAIDPDRLLQAQRRLRSQLLERAAGFDSAVQDLAAHMLLYLDQPDRCWITATEWLVRSIDVERVDGGWAKPTERVYEAAQYETLREAELGTIRGLAVDGGHRTLQMIWSSSRPIVHEDMEQASLFDEELRRYFLGRGVHTKMTAAIVYRRNPIGLLCVDRMSSKRRWTQAQYDRFSTVTRKVLPPVLGEAWRLLTSHVETPRSEADALSARTLPLDGLTVAERRLCRLVVQGLSYKEMARQTDRAFSTIDHQLRSIRRKLGVASTARLITLLSAQEEAERRPPVTAHSLA